MRVRGDVFHNGLLPGKKIRYQPVLPSLISVPVPGVPVEVLGFFRWLEKIVASRDYSRFCFESPRTLDMERILTNLARSHFVHPAKVEHAHVRRAVRGGKRQSNQRFQVAIGCFSYVFHCSFGQRSGTHLRGRPVRPHQPYLYTYRAIILLRNASDSATSISKSGCMMSSPMVFPSNCVTPREFLPAQ